MTANDNITLFVHKAALIPLLMHINMKKGLYGTYLSYSIILMTTRNK